MNFSISTGLKAEIEKYFTGDTDLKNKLLSGDAEAIKKVGIKSKIGVSPEDIVKAYEQKDMEAIYKRAKKIMKLKEIYEKLCKEYTTNYLDEER